MFFPAARPRIAVLAGWLSATAACAVTPPASDETSRGGSSGEVLGSGGAGSGGNGGTTAGGSTGNVSGGNGGGVGVGGGGGAPASGGSPGRDGGSAGSGGTTGSPGGTGGSLGSGGGSAASGGTSGQGGAAGAPDASGGDAGIETPPITECPGPSIDRLQKWLGHAHLIGSGGDASILAQESGKYVAKARFDGVDWSEIVVLIGNDAGASIDLSASKGFSITYSATADLWMEFRGTVHLHGGDQWGVKLPATGGAMMTRFVSFDPSNWGEIPGLDKPAHAYAGVLKTANMFDIVGDKANTVAFYGLRFDKYVPACR